MDNDRTTGKATHVVGPSEEAIGRATGHKNNERSGKADQVTGNAQAGVGKAKIAFATKSEVAKC